MGAGRIDVLVGPVLSPFPPPRWGGPQNQGSEASWSLGCP